MKDVYDTFLKGERMNKRQTTILDLLSKSKKIEVSSFGFNAGMLPRLRFVKIWMLWKKAGSSLENMGMPY